MAARDPAERALSARLAALRLHSTNDPRAHTAPARAAFARSDHSACRVCKAPPIPDGLTEAERLRRLELRRREHFTRLALKSSKARRAPAA